MLNVQHLSLICLSPALYIQLPMWHFFTRHQKPSNFPLKLHLLARLPSWWTSSNIHLWPQARNVWVFLDDSLSFTTHLIRHQILCIGSPKWSSDPSFYCFHDHHPRPSFYHQPSKLLLYPPGLLPIRNLFNMPFWTLFAEACQGFPLNLG